MEQYYLEMLTIRQRVVHFSIMLVALIIVSIYSYFDIINSSMFVLNVGRFSFSFAHLPLILLGGYLGFLPTMIVTVVIFAIAAFHNLSYAYVAFIFFIAGAVAFNTAESHWFTTVKGIVLTIIIEDLVLSNTIYLVLCLGSTNGFARLSPFAMLVMSLLPLPECIIGTLFTASFLIYAPDRIKKYTYNGFRHTEVFAQLKAEQRFLRKGISFELSVMNFMLIALVIVCMAFIGIGYYYRMIGDPFLSPDTRVVDLYRHDKVTDLNALLRDYITQEQATAAGLKFQDQPAILTLKFFLMLVPIAVPLMFTADFIVQAIVLLPLYDVTSLMVGYVKTTDLNREAYVEKIKNADSPYLRKDNEIGSLYRSILAMAEQVTIYLNQIQNDNNLHIQLETEKKANKAKTDFLSNVSHEIRTPINAIMGMDEMILRETSEVNITQYALDIQESAKILLSLVNGILDSSKIEAGKMEIIPVEYDLSSLINDLVNLTAQRARDKHLDLFVNVDKEIPHVLFGDEVRLRQCITNILTNAVKYTSEGSITLSLGYRKLKDGRNIVISVAVTDTGAGIKQEDIKKLFHPFERIDEVKNRNIEGTGLGMSIVQNLLFLMGSQLNVESEYGKGSTFSFDIVQRVVNWDPIGDYAETYNRIAVTAKQYNEKFTAPEAKILVVDDVPMNLKVVVNLLKKTKIRIDTADSGFEMLDRIQQKRYDIIFLDHRMPDMDGIETLQKMNDMGEENLCKGVPVIALTANAVTGSREMYFKAGFTNYLSKPIDSDKLEEMIVHYLPDELIEYQREEEDDTDTAAETEEWRRLDALEGIDLSVARQYADHPDFLISSMRDYCAAIDDTSNKIEKYLEEGDIKNYTIVVHALKSSSRLIGAVDLSEKAKHLEACGDNNDIDEIREKTPELLREYRDLRSILSPVIKEEDDDTDKPQITESQLSEAYDTLKQFADNFDFDGIDSVIDALKKYSFPDKYKKKWKSVREAASLFDRDQLIELLSEDSDMREG